MRKGTYYDDDEILIFGGKVADEVAFQVARGAYEDIHDAVRNAAADAAEEVMREWTGRASVPLPEDLRDSMVEAARAAATKRYADFFSQGEQLSLRKVLKAA